MLSNEKMQVTVQSESPFYPIVANTKKCKRKTHCTHTHRKTHKDHKEYHAFPRSHPSLNPACSLDVVGQGCSGLGGVHVVHGYHSRGAGIAGQRAGGLREEARWSGSAHGQGRAHRLLLQAAPHEDAQDQCHRDDKQGQQGEKGWVAEQGSQACRWAGDGRKGAYGDKGRHTPVRRLTSSLLV